MGSRQAGVFALVIVPCQGVPVALVGSLLCGETTRVLGTSGPDPRSSTPFQKQTPRSRADLLITHGHGPAGAGPAVADWLPLSLLPLAGLLWNLAIC